MTKKYQRSELDTSALAVPEQVSVPMGEIAADLREGLLALAVGSQPGTPGVNGTPDSIAALVVEGALRRSPG